MDTLENFLGAIFINSIMGVIQGIFSILLIYVPKIIILKDLNSFPLIKRGLLSILLVVFSSIVYIGSNFLFLIVAVSPSNDSVGLLIASTFLTFPILSLVLVIILLKWNIKFLPFLFIAILSSIFILNFPYLVVFLTQKNIIK